MTSELMTKLPPSEISISHRIMASSIGGMLTAIIMTPLDVIKIRMQSDRLLTNNCFVYCNGLMDHICTCFADSSPSAQWYKRRGNFNGIWVGFHSHLSSQMSPRCVYHAGNLSTGLLPQYSLSATDAAYKIVQKEGIFSLWSGLSPTLAMALPQTVIYFTINDWLKDWIGYSHMTNLNKPRNKSQWFYLYDLVPPLVGGASRVFAVTAISPLELIRTKMQSIRMVPSEIFTLVAKSIKQDGPQSLWRGVGPTLLRDIPYSMLFWMIYDYSKSVYLRDKYYENRLSLNNTTTDQLSFSKAFTFGAMSGLIAGVLTHPFDVIKTHRQVELGNSLSGDTYPKSTWKSLRLLYASSGLSSLFTGFTPRLLKTTCASAIMIGTFESFKYNFSRLDQPITEPVLNDDNGS